MTASERIAPDVRARIVELELGATDQIDLVVELTPDAEVGGPDRTRPSRSERQARAAAAERRFATRMSTLGPEFERSGIEVTGTTWLSQSIRVRVPVAAVEVLAQHPDVLRIDVERPIVPDQRI